LRGKELKKSFSVNSDAFETEVDRIKAVREGLGIKMRGEDEVYIVGRAATLRNCNDTLNYYRRTGNTLLSKRSLEI
jgi:hypothetical protein